MAKWNVSKNSEVFIEFVLTINLVIKIPLIERLQWFCLNLDGKKNKRDKHNHYLVLQLTSVIFL